MFIIELNTKSKYIANNFEDALELIGILQCSANKGLSIQVKLYDLQGKSREAVPQEQFNLEEKFSIWVTKFSFVKD